MNTMNIKCGATEWLCPTCDKALWVRVEIKGFFGTKKITVKEQPNFCKYCGQALLPAYTEH